MKLARLYATSLMRLEKSGKTNGIVANLVADLKKRGRLKLLPAILSELKAMHQNSSNVLVEAASEKEAAAARAGAKAAGIDAQDAVINPSLIRGWRARGNGILADHSAKRALLDLYARVTG